MKEFRDTKNRVWKLEVNVDVIEQVQAATNANLLDLADPQSDLLAQVNLAPPLLGKLLFAAIGEQAKIAGVDEREFKRSMDGDALAAASDALMDELVLFFPKRRRDLLAEALKQNRRVEEAGIRLALEKLQDPELEQRAIEAMDRDVAARITAVLQSLGPAEVEEKRSANGSSTSAGSPPDCSASPTPDLTPGAG